MGCYNPPSLTEISSRDLWKEGGGGAQENDEGCIGRGDQRLLDSWTE
jgi:hypothetical protein